MNNQDVRRRENTMKEFEFDDEIFGESTSKESKIEEAYKPKQCDPEWFMQCSPNCDPSERQTIRKYQGDLLFQKQNYSEAFDMYQESRQYLPLNNTVLDRELIESMAICLLKLGKCEDAVTLLKETTEDDNQQNDSSLWYLLSRIYRAMENTQGEIESLQRCATLHSWNSRFWFSLALAYERATTSCIQPQDGNFKDDNRGKNCLLHQDLTEKSCKENSLKGEWQSHQETDFTIRSCCASNNKAQDPILRKPHDSDELEIRQCFQHLGVRDQGDLAHVTLYKCGCQLPSSIQVESPGIQEHSHRIWYSNRNCSESLKEDGDSSLFSSNRKHLHLPEQCWCGKDKLKWRNHVLAFGSLVKSRFFLEKAIEASSSFARDKSEALLREVNAKITAHTECGCAQLIDKVLELLYSSVLASEQVASDQGQSDVKTKECKQEEHSATTNVTNSFDFEQKWFGDLLSYLLAN